MNNFEGVLFDMIVVLILIGIPIIKGSESIFPCSRLLSRFDFSHYTRIL
jgi:hypothetical protein